MRLQLKLERITIDCFYFIAVMSIAFKKNSFRVEIRRQNLSKLLSHKRLQQFSSTEVNQTLAQYLHQYPHLKIPKIFAIKYELIDKEHLQSFIDILNSNPSRIDAKNTFDIALLNKLFFSDHTLFNHFFNQVTQFAQKILFALRDSLENQNTQSYPKGPQKLYLKLPANLIEDFIFLPNCLIQYWANFFSSTKEGTEIPMKAYCTIMKCFIKWFSSKNINKPNFSKYSVCYFLRNFFESENIFTPETSEAQDKNYMYAQIEELYIKFRIVSMSVVLRLLEQQFYCQELINLMQILNKRKLLSNDLLRALRESENKYFFEMILEGIDNETILIAKEQSIIERFFHSKQISQQTLKTLSELSVQKILKKDISLSIWCCKISILDIFNTFLTINNFDHLFYESQVEKIIEKLISIYIYSTEQGIITNRVQKTICIILYNILSLAQNQLDQEDDDEFACLKIYTEDLVSIHQKITDYFLQNTQHFADIVIKTQYTVYDHIVEMILIMERFSEFLNVKQIDQKIMDQGRLVMRICDAFDKNIFSEEEILKIMESLFYYLERLNDCYFDFSFSFEDLQRLKETRIKAFLTSNQEDLLGQILKPLEPYDQII